MDVTPLVPPGRQLIERYGAAGFRISGVDHAGAVLVRAEHTLAWGIAAPADITFASLEPILAPGGVEILLLGTGRRLVLPSPALRMALRKMGIAVEPMDSGAACRTYNVLLAEDRRVAAALLLPA